MEKKGVNSRGIAELRSSHLVTEHGVVAMGATEVMRELLPRLKACSLLRLLVPAVDGNDGSKKEEMKKDKTKNKETKGKKEKKEKTGKKEKKGKKEK